MPTLPPYPFPAVTDTVMSVLLKGVMGDLGGGPKNAYNQFYYRLTTTTTAYNKASLNTRFQAVVVAPLLVAAHARYAPTAVDIRRINDNSDLATTFAAAGVGSVATDSEPSDDAVVVNLMSGFRGKNVRGNKHFAGSSEIQTTGDILNATGLTAWTPVRDACKLALTDADGNVWTPFILSKTWSKFKPTVQIFGVNVNNAVLLKTIGTMRKRRTKTQYAA